MHWLVIVLITVFLGPLGCATFEVNDKYRQTVDLRIKSIQHYSAEAQRVNRVCVVAVNWFYSEDPMEYEIRITPPDSKEKCVASPELSDEICDTNVPVTKVTSRDVTLTCKEVENSENYKAVIERLGDYSVYSIKEEGKDKIVSYVSIGTLYYTPPHYFVLNTLALTWDIVTFPAQLLLYSFGVIGADWFKK